MLLYVSCDCSQYLPDHKAPLMKGEVRKLPYGRFEYESGAALRRPRIVIIVARASRLHVNAAASMKNRHNYVVRAFRRHALPGWKTSRPEAYSNGEKILLTAR